MKRFISILCTCLLVVGCLAGYAAPTQEVSAADPEEKPASISLMYFDNPSSYDNSSYNVPVTVTEVTGSAISLTHTCRNRWFSGIVKVSPESGYEYKGLSAGTSEGKVINLSDSDWEDAKSSQNAYLAMRGITELPESINSAISELGTLTGADKAIFISDEVIHGDGVEGIPVILTFYFMNDDSSKTMTLTINPDSIDVYIEAETHGSIKLFESMDMLNPSSQTRLSEDFAKYGRSIEDYQIQRLSSDACRYIDLEGDTNSASYIYRGNGEQDFMVTDKASGLIYWVYTFKQIPDDVVLSVKINEELPKDNDMGSVTTAFLTKCGILRADYPENDILEVRLVSDKTLTFGDILALGDFETGRQITGTQTTDYESERRTYNITFKTDKGLGKFVIIPITYESATYALMIQLDAVEPSASINARISNCYEQTNTYAPSTMFSIYDYMAFDTPEQKAIFEASLSEDGDRRYELEADGLMPILENGVFKGKVLFVHPFERIGLLDSGEERCGQKTNFSVRTNVAIKSGSQFDLRTLMGGYWDMNDTDIVQSWKHSSISSLTNYNQEPDSSDVARSYYLTTVKQNEEVFKLGTPYIFNAPTVTEAERFTLTVYSIKRDRYNSNENPENLVSATFIVTVYPEGKFVETAADIIEKLEEKEELVADIGDEDSNILAKEVLDALSEGKQNKLIIKNKKNAHSVEWNFSSNVLTGQQTKNLDLEVRVGGELSDTTLDEILAKNNITGIKAGFANNGALPGDTEVRIYFTEEEVKQFKNPNHIQVYYQNGNGISKEAENCYICKDPTREGYYFITITLTHNSNFVLTSATGNSYGGSTGGGSTSEASASSTETTPAAEDKTAEETAPVANTDDTTSPDPETKVTEYKDGSSKEVTTTEEKTETGATVVKKETVKKDADGNVTSAKEVSTIEATGKVAAATVTVNKDADGETTSASAKTESKGTVTETGVKTTLNAATLKTIKEAAGTDDVVISQKVTAEDGSKFTLKVNAGNVTAGAKLSMVKIVNGEMVLVSAETYKVTKSGNISASVSGSGTYQLLSQKEIKALNKEILATVAPAKKSEKVTAGEKTSFKLSDSLNMKNVAGIEYETADKGVATISKKGKITAKGKGSVKVTAIVTLKNGKTKKITMTIKVK